MRMDFKRVLRIFLICLLPQFGLHTLAADDRPTDDLAHTVAAAASYESGQSKETFRRIEEAMLQSSSNIVVRRELEAGLLKLLSGDSTYEARKFACQQLGIIGSQAALPVIGKLLADTETVGIACLALTTYPPGKADDILRTALRSANAVQRVQIINTLGDRHDTKSISALAQYAASTDNETAEAAIAALGKIGTPAAWKALQKVLARSGGEASPAATDAMLRCAESLEADGNSKSARAIYEDLLAGSALMAARRSALAALLATDRDGGERRITEVLAGKDDALKPVAIAAMASVDTPSVAEKFASQIHHLRPEHQVLMIESLAERGDDAARLQLAKALSSPESSVRRTAIVALGRMGDPYFLSLLAQAAGNASGPEETRAVETALVGLKGGAETDQAMMAQLKLASPKARVPLIAAIAQRQGAAASAVLLDEAGNTDPASAKAAFRALAKVGGGKDAAPLLAKLVSLEDAGVRDDAESAAVQLLRKMSSGAERTKVVREALARATTIQSRNALLVLLPACGDETALAELKSATADSEFEVRETAVRVLADWPDDAAWEALVAIYRKPEQESMRSMALRGLVRLLDDQNAHPDAALVERYKEVFATARAETDLRLLLGTVAGAAHPDVLPLVLPLLSNPAVRVEAALAVKQIAESVKAQHPEVAERALKQLPGGP